MPFFKSTPSELDLIKGCLRNDRRSQQLLFQQYLNSLIAVARAYILNEQDVLEIVQDSFLKIFQHVDRYDAKQSSLYTWMRTIVVRTAIDHLRKGKQAPQQVEWTEAHDAVVEADALSGQTAAEILQLLKQLPDTTRMVFNLFITEGYSHREISGALNISEGTSRWHLSEARKYMSNSMKKQKRA
jgi:RNA polymerase sigma factor (sigma-70 family)